MADIIQQLDDLQAEANAALLAADDAGALEAFRVKFLGSKGAVRAAMKLLGQVSAAEKPVIGQRLNALTAELTSGLEAKRGQLGSVASGTAPAIDLTEPGRRSPLGARHVLMKTIDELVELFGRMGFATASGPEVEDEFHNFIALNIPTSHPARDPLDNFYIAPSAGRPGMINPHPKLLRTQTSTVQIRVMETQPPPIRVVIPGRVYRPDTHDDTHLSMFHQLEALVVDEHVTMVDLKSTILQFVHAYFGPETRVRFRPSFFPFTEPSAEVDVWFDATARWVELGGCGMVHPNVLRAVKIDPDRYSGWAFGFGVERIAMRKYGILNIRQLVENDTRFLSQF